LIILSLREGCHKNNNNKFTYYGYGEFRQPYIRIIEFVSMCVHKSQIKTLKVQFRRRRSAAQTGLTLGALLFIARIK
jgi:hypothetical protein